jgi:hypothetical protein
MKIRGIWKNLFVTLMIVFGLSAASCNVSNESDEPDSNIGAARFALARGKPACESDPDSDPDTEVDTGWSWSTDQDTESDTETSYFDTDSEADTETSYFDTDSEADTEWSSDTDCESEDEDELKDAIWDYAQNCSTVNPGSSSSGLISLLSLL